MCIDFPGGSDGKASAYNAGDPGSIPGSGRSPGEGNGNPLQYLWPPQNGAQRNIYIHTRVCVCVCVYAQLLNCVQLFVTPLTVAGQAPLSMGFSRQEYWSRLPFPSPGTFPNPEMEPVSPAFKGGFFTTLPPGKPSVCIYMCVCIYVFHCNSHCWLSTWINMSASSKLTLISVGNN